MRWVKANAAAVVLMLGVFVAAIPPASIGAPAHAAPLATDADDDDSAAMAQRAAEEEEQQNEQAEQQAQMDQPN
jgi:hypothetical protein